MPSEEGENRLLLVAAVALLISAVLIVDAGIRGTFPAVLNFDYAFVVLAAIQAVAAAVLLRRVRKPRALLSE